jgi:4-hydroxy-4-methyl-2-oxoglutarate aldolase
VRDFSDEVEAFSAGRIYESADPADPALLKELAGFGTAPVMHAFPPMLSNFRLIEPAVLPRRTGKRAVAGVAVTAWNQPGSTGMNSALLEMARPCDFLVIRADDRTPNWGDIMATRAQSCGVVGALVDGVCRDIEAVEALGFSLWGKHVSIGDGARRMRPGLINVPVPVGGTIVVPGDIIVADSDGIVVVPRQWLADVTELARRKAQRDEGILASASRGEIAPSLRATYAAPGPDPDLHRVGAPWK